MKSLTILGASGNIGQKCIELLKENIIKYKLIAVSVGNNIEYLKEILNDFNSIKYVYFLNKNYLNYFQNNYKNINFYCENDLDKFIKDANSDIYINSLVGFVGVKPSFEILNLNKDLALANKESIVVGLDLFKDALKKSKSKLYPIDSEHVAILKLLKGNRNNLKEVVLTCSGGPFKDKSEDELQFVKLKDALKHPSWNMGNKITIDSATLLNKAFEIVEASYLFNLSKNKIKVVIHPQSYVHSMIKLIDNTYLFDFGEKDMKIPISYALNKNKRVKTNIDFDIYDVNKLEFYKPNQYQNKILNIGYEILNKKGNLGAIVNAANDFVVNKFMNNEIEFLDIQKLIFYAMNHAKYIKNPSLNDIIKTNDEVRKMLLNLIKK